MWEPCDISSSVVHADCPPVRLALNDSVITGDYSTRYGSVFTVTCLPGYKFMSEEHVDKQSVHMECQEKGQWNVNVSPTCERKYFLFVDLSPTCECKYFFFVDMSPTCQCKYFFFVDMSPTSECRVGIPCKYLLFVDRSPKCEQKYFLFVDM